MDSSSSINTRQRSFRGTWPNPRVWFAFPVVWGSLRSAVFWSTQLGRAFPQHWRFPPAVLAGMPTGPKVFLAMLEACGLRACDRTHLKKVLYYTRSFGGVRDRLLDQTPVFGAPLHLLGRTSACCFVNYAARSGVPRHWRSLWPQGAVHQVFPPLWGVGLLPGAWGAFSREMSTGTEVFLKMPGAYELFQIACSSLEYLPSTFFFIRFVRVQMVRSYSSRDDSDFIVW